MYCSTCGAAVAKGLPYCNYCGAKLGVEKSVGDSSRSKPAELFPESLIWAIVSVFVVGFGCTIGMMAVMKNVLNASDTIINTIILLSFLLMFSIEGVFIWLLVNRRSAVQEAGASRRLNAQETKELEGTQARALPEPMPSVTEHTTRAFDPLYVERKSK
jgi:hypothetical protein